MKNGSFGLSVNGSTPLAEALWPAAIELLRGADVNARKILMVITDGQPNCADQTVAMTNKIRESGIDVFCLGFGSVDPAFLKRCYGDRGIDVQTVSNLSRALFQILKTQI
ncbi:von Willebrand factor type A domain protein [compost metagenome]